MTEAAGLLLIGFGCGLAVATLRIRLWRRGRDEWVEADRHKEFGAAIQKDLQA